MNRTLSGVVLTLVFVVLESTQFVYFGGLFQRMSSFHFGALVFGAFLVGAHSSWAHAGSDGSCFELAIRVSEARERINGGGGCQLRETRPPGRPGIPVHPARSRLKISRLPVRRDAFRVSRLVGPILGLDIWLISSGCLHDVQRIPGGCHAELTPLC